jgi:hypothetical protein
MYLREIEAILMDIEKPRGRRKTILYILCFCIDVKTVLEMTHIESSPAGAMVAR